MLQKVSTGDALANQIAEKERQYAEMCAAKPGINTQSAQFIGEVPNRLFDIGRPGAGETEVCFRCSRETFYCTHKVANREGVRYGLMGEPVSTVVGKGKSLEHKSQFARSDKKKDFFRKGTGGSLWAT